jgi:glycosyltransferase involved in cell wall biosynthesis
MFKVSVVIPTYNRISRLKKVLKAFEDQIFDKNAFEVIVVSDGSTDGTHETISELKTTYHLNLLIQINQGPAAARNLGLAKALGEYILFVDDDVMPTPELIVEHMRVHDEQGKNIVVLGPMLTPQEFNMSPWVRWEQAMLVKQYQSMQNGHWQPTARQFYTGNTSLQRSHLLESGGFDPKFRRAEDVELAYRLKNRGLQFVFNSKAIGYHYAERSFPSWIETPYIYGKNDVIFARDKQQIWLLQAVFEEFRTRNLLIRFLVLICLDRIPLSNFIIRILQILAQQSDQLGLEKIVQMTHSAIFNLRYYQGISDELNGRNNFLKQAE